MPSLSTDIQEAEKERSWGWWWWCIVLSKVFVFWSPQKIIQGPNWWILQGSNVSRFTMPGCLKNMGETPKRKLPFSKENWFSGVKVAGARCSAFGTKLLLYLFSRCIVGPCALLSWILSWMVCWMVGLWSKSCRRPDGKVIVMSGEVYGFNHPTPKVSGEGQGVQ